MIRFALAAALVATATLASVGGVSAGPLQFNPINTPIVLLPLGQGSKGAKVNGPITSPGDAFYPQTATVDVREECLAAGGTPKRTFDGTDFVWTCRQ